MILKCFFTVENKKNKKITWKKNQENLLLFFHSQKQILKFHTWNVFYRQKLFHSSFTLEKIRQIFRNFTWNYFKKKIQVKFLRGFSEEMFNSVRFTHEIKSSECFFDRFHTHTKKTYKFSPIFFPLTWRKKKYLHFCCHSKLFSWKKKKKVFFTQFHIQENKILLKMCLYSISQTGE